MTTDPVKRQMPMSYFEILDKQTQSTMVSSWQEYLCVRSLSKGKAVVEICAYEGLSGEGEWVSEDEEGNPIELPDTYNGKDVVGFEDGILVGGELQCWNEEDRMEYDEHSIKSVLEWIKGRGFYIDGKMKKSLKKALTA